MEKVKQVDNNTFKKGIVKQVLTGDTLIIRAQPRGGPPPEKQISISGIIAAKLARKPAPGQSSEELKEEPWAWEAKEFLRKLVIGKEVYFVSEKVINSTKEYGTIYLDKDGKKNLAHLLVSEGMVSVRRENKSLENNQLIELEDIAKTNSKGKWNNNAKNVIREIKWTVNNPTEFLQCYKGKRLPAIIEHVRDGSSFRVLLTENFTYITIILSGIRCPSFKIDANGKINETITVPYAQEAKFFSESRLLNQDIEILLEGLVNTNFIGSIFHPKGNIAEALVREGLAKCVDWSLNSISPDVVEKLRSAEKVAKVKKLRLWENYEASLPQEHSKEFTGIVSEVLNGDGIVVKRANGQLTKVFFSSIRPPKENRSDDEVKRTKTTRILYEIPYLYECREFLRKRLIGKKVSCKFDYMTPAKENLPEKTYYTVTSGGINIAESLVVNGLCTVMRYRQDNDQRSSRYNDLLLAEANAIKEMKGVHGKKENLPVRLIDLTVDTSKIRHQYLPSWQRALRVDAVVEYVTSGSKFRVFVTKDNCLVNFLLMGITCPKSSRPAIGGSPPFDGEPYGDEALNFVKDKIYQRDITLQIETADKGFNCIIGWLFLENKNNLSVLLVEEGLAQVHSASAERSEYVRLLNIAQEKAKNKHLKIWKNYVEEVKEIDQSNNVANVEENIEVAEEVIITDVSTDLMFYAQKTKNMEKLNNLMDALQTTVSDNTLGNATNPRKGEILAAKFSDNQWYRAKIEKLTGDKAKILYIDYGNQEDVKVSQLINLPHSMKSDPPYATLYKLAFVSLPTDEEDKNEALKFFASDILDKKLNIEVQYRINGIPHAKLSTIEGNEDIGKNLVVDGYVLVDPRKETKLKTLVKSYKEAAETAKKTHLGIWRYGDITEDVATEFGVY